MNATTKTSKTSKHLTLASVRRQLQHFNVVIARSSPNELRVNCKGHSEASAYYTSDLLDALDTGRLMAAARDKRIAEMKATRQEGEMAALASGCDCLSCTAQRDAEATEAAKRAAAGIKTCSECKGAVEDAMTKCQRCGLAVEPICQQCHGEAFVICTDCADAAYDAKQQRDAEKKLERVQMTRAQYVVLQRGKVEALRSKLAALLPMRDEITGVEYADWYQQQRLSEAHEVASQFVWRVEMLKMAGAVAAERGYTEVIYVDGDVCYSKAAE